MILPVLKLSSLLENMAAAVQGGSAQLIDLSIGSVLRALLEASAAAALWMQWLILQVLSVTRAATSTGPDLDSWMADFGLTRLPGAASVGLVSFARYTAGVAATIPVGAMIYTSDRSQGYLVTANSSNPAWNGVSGYTLAALVTSVLVPVQAVTPGIAGNVLAGAIGWLAAGIVGVDNVGNPGPFTGGIDPESDIALRTRFQLYINSRSLATVESIEFAVASLRQGLRFVVRENIDTAGQVEIGHFWVVVDDGSGSPADSLLTSASLAVDGVRPIGSTFSVTGPIVVVVSVQLVVVTGNPATHAAVCAGIAAAITAWIASLPIAGTLAVSKLEALAHSTDPGVISVTTATINGLAQDVSAPQSGVLIASGVVVS